MIVTLKVSADHACVMRDALRFYHSMKTGRFHVLVAAMSILREFDHADVLAEMNVVKYEVYRLFSHQYIERWMDRYPKDAAIAYGMCSAILNSIIDRRGETLSIDIAEVQYPILQTSLDLYSRIMMGQIAELTTTFDSFEWSYRDAEKKRLRAIMHPDEVLQLLAGRRRRYVDFPLEQVKRIIFPELGDAYYGIYADEVGEDAHIAWDIQQSLRYAVAWHECPEGKIYKDFDNPTQCAKEPLPQVAIDGVPVDLLKKRPRSWSM